MVGVFTVRLYMYDVLSKVTSFILVWRGKHTNVFIQLRNKKKILLSSLLLLFNTATGTIMNCYYICMYHYYCCCYYHFSILHNLLRAFIIITIIIIITVIIITRSSLFVLRFHGPGNPMGSCRARPVYLTTRLLGRLSPLSG